jgi:hypothetical protein
MSSSTLSNTNNTLAPLGAYLNAQPDRSNAANETNFERQYTSFATLMGTRPQFYDAFTDFTQNPSQWASSAGFGATSFAQSGTNFIGPGSGTIPVIGVPMATSAYGPSKADPDPFYKQIISGALDASYTGIVDSWANAGFKTAEFRIGYEFNGSMAWTPAATGSDNADFVAAWQHIANLIHAEGAKDGITAKTIWNPSTANGGAYDVQTLYPGDQFVDVVSVDVYGGGTPNNLVDFATGGTTVDSSYAVWAAKPANIEHYYLYENFTLGNLTPGLGATGASGYGWSVADTITFAKLHNKPLGIDETGATSGQDDSIFPAWLASTISGAKAGGVIVDHVNIWSNGISTWDFVNGERPQEAASWVTGFGAGSNRPTGGTMTISLSAPGTVQEATLGAGVTVTEIISTTNLTGNVYEEVLTSSGAVESGYKAVALNSGGSATSSVFLAKSGDRIRVVDNPTAPNVTTDSSPVTITNPPVPAPPAVTIGSGTDTLALQVSEDAWQGNALFTVSIDGKQIGGTQTAVASHAAGQTQVFNVLGTFPAGSHTATVSFLNDGYGGSPAADRNLYVIGATIDNSVVPAAMLNLARTGSQGFSFLAPGGSRPANTVSVNRPTLLQSGLRTITGTESDPSQSIFLDWNTSRIPTLTDSGWVQAKISSSGAFSADVTIDPAGTTGALFYRIGSGPTLGAWSGIPS